MPVSFERPNRGYILYIDEAGDTGLRKVRPLEADGASEWLVIGGVLIRDSREAETVEWVRELRKGIRGAQRPDLHFRLLTETRKSAICSATALRPLRGFALLSNKKNMRGYRNRRVEEARPSAREWFYNYCVRLLLERVTRYVAGRTLKDYGEFRHLEIVFSTRGGMRYSQTQEYYDLMTNQARAGLTVLNKREVDPRVLHAHLVKTASPINSAGVQLADIVASSFYQAADALGPGHWSPQHAKLLRPIMATADGECRECGVSLQPTPPRRAQLTQQQQEIFRFYGYDF